VPDESSPASSSPPNLHKLSVQEFLSRLAEKTATPGGGSVAALTGALAAAQAHMVLAYTIGKPKFAAYEKELKEQSSRLLAAVNLFIELMETDAAAYELLNPLLKLSPSDRRNNPQFAPTLLAAIRIPQSVCAAGAQVLLACTELVDISNPQLVSDLGVAASLANAAVQTAALNVHVNLALLDDAAEAQQLREEISSITRRSAVVWKDFSQKISDRLNATE